MTALSGRPMSTAYAARLHTRRPARVALDFEAAGGWLAELQSRSLAHVEPLDMDGDVRARLRGRFGNDPSLQADLDCLAAVHARLRLNEVPRTVVHGDFWLGNVLLSEGRVSGVVDWEAATTCGEPVRDLVRFANMYALYLDHRARPGRRVRGHRDLRAGEWGAALEYALYGTGWFPALYRRFLEDGLTRLGAAPESWRDAALAGIAEVAALTDHEEFGRRHLELFRRLASREVEA
jgi:aminoglycoside phosphotransferase (APT) family kinase protein